MTAPSPQQVPPTTLRSSATAATATTWNPTQQYTIAEYFVKYNMETIPESLNGELPPLPSGSSHGSRGHTYNHNGHNQNLHVPKRSNTFTASTSTSQTKHQRYAGAESQTQERPSSSLSRSFTSPLSSPSPSDSGSRMIGGGKSTQRVREWVKRSNSSRYVFTFLSFSHFPFRCPFTSPKPSLTLTMKRIQNQNLRPLLLQFRPPNPRNHPPRRRPCRT